jgi:hypothetical protein
MVCFNYVQQFDVWFTWSVHFARVLRGLALNFASKHQAENPRGFSEVVENKQLLIAIVSCSFYNIGSYSIS